MFFWWVFFAAVNVQVQVFKEMIGRLSKGNRADHEPFVQAVPWELEAAVWRHVQLSVMCHAAGLLPLLLLFPALQKAGVVLLWKK